MSKHLDSVAPSWVKGHPKSKPPAWTHEKAPAKPKSKSGDDAKKLFYREMNKRLRPIYEDAGKDYGDDVGEDEIFDRYNVASDLRTKSIKSVMSEISRSRQVDLCFCVDCTGSMQAHINGVRDCIMKVVDHLTKSKNAVATSIRLGFVGYRDHGDTPNQFEVLDFVSDVSSFRAFCAKITASGGGGMPEDVHGALEKLCTMTWSSNAGTRVVFHIADAPCHGIAVSGLSGGQDSYPDGDPRGRSHETLFAKLRELLVQYHFGKINSYTDKMIENFSRAYGERITDYDVKDTSKILDSVVDSVSKSVSNSVDKSKTTISIGRTKRPFTIEPMMPSWDRLGQVEGQFMTYKLPHSIDDIMEGIPLDKNDIDKAYLKIAPHPFAHGTERLVYYGQDRTGMNRGDPSVKPQLLVLKEYMYVGKGMNSVVRYEHANQSQSVAAFFAQQFNVEVISKIPAWDCTQRVKFLKIKTLFYSTGTSKRFMSCERAFDDGATFLRFSNNVDYSMVEAKAIEAGVDMEQVQFLMTFTHWTHTVTKEYLMIVDLQGIVTSNEGRGSHHSDGFLALKGGRILILTDPVIHCTDKTRFGPMNHGEDGMKNFFDRHECNRFCDALELKNPYKRNIGSVVTPS